VLAVFGVAALLRLAAVLLISWQPAFDDAWYFRTARELAAGSGYLDDEGRVTAYFPVGYPLTLSLFLRVFGSSFLAAQLANIVLSMATMACVYLIAREVGAGKRFALAAAALLGFLPNQVVSCCVTMSEITFTFALTLGVLLALKAEQRSARWFALVGVAFGWATLIRPQALFVPLLLVPLFAYVRHKRAVPWRTLALRSAFVLAGLAISVGPWTYRNYRVFGELVLVSTNGGENLLIGNNPTASGRYTASVEVFPKDIDVRKLPELERDKLGRKLAKEYLREQPTQALMRAPKKLWYLFRSDLGVTNWIWDAQGSSKTLFYYLCQGATQLGYLLVLGAGFVGWLLAWRKPPAGVGYRLMLAAGACITAYFSAITLVFFGDARFHQPFMPFLALAAAYTLAARPLAPTSPVASPTPT
jgi:4-amino-4-deoxy-L-arabinose transferase-like glycosyltransferase